MSPAPALASRLRYSANLGLLFPELPLLERMRAAAEVGFTAIECWFPYDIPAIQFRQVMQRHALRCVSLNAAAGQADRGEFGLAGLPHRAAEFRASIEQALDYAEAIDCAQVHVLAGVCATEDAAAAWACYRDNLRWACQQAARRQRIILIEPLNPHDRPGYLLTRQAQAASLIGELAQPNLRLMMDFYHVQRTEGNLLANLHRHLPIIGHIQIADVPGRHEPGTGEIHFARVLSAIEAADYPGWIGCEYAPQAGHGAGLSWLGERVPAP